MLDLLTPGFLTALISAGLLSAVPLLFASLGETVAEQSGMFNVGLEGMMLTGAFLGFIVALDTGDSWLGLLAGGVAGVLISLVMVVFCIRLGLDQIVVGIAIVLSVEGITSLLHATWFGTTYPRLPAIPPFAIPILRDVPVLGGSLFSQPLPVYLVIALAALMSWASRRTTIGLNVRAAGERPDSLDAAGVSVVRVRTGAEMFCGAMGGVGGAYLAIEGAGTFVPLVTNGIGFMAIVVAMLARGRPWWALGGAVLFGMSLALARALQLVGITVPVDLVQMLPFISVIAVLVIFARNANLPSAMGQPYVRGSR